jgi:glutamate-1-semialdehyde 2,1-aminomutase
MALAAAVAYTGRKKILAFRNGYHGGTLSFPLTIKEINTNLPHDFILAPYNDISGSQSVLDTLPKDSLAAIIVEPIQGSGGSIPGNEDFLHFLNTSANNLGALFIVDEVMTSRLSYHGLSSELGLSPDLITLGKWIGGGMTFGAFGGRKRVMGMFDPRDGLLAHSGTFNNNIITMAAGCTGIDLFNEAEVKRLNALGDSLRNGLQEILSKHQINQIQPAQFRPCPQKNELESPFTGTRYPNRTSDSPVTVESLSLSNSLDTMSSNSHHPKKGSMWVSGRGSMMNIHFSGESDKSLQALFWHYMLEHGMYLAQRGFISLNIELNDSHVKKFLKVAEGFVEMYQAVLEH